MNTVVMPHLQVRKIVNLNDWRTQARAAVRQRLLLLLLLGVAMNALCVGVAWTTLRSWQAEAELERSRLTSRSALLAEQVDLHRSVSADLAVWRAVPALQTQSHVSRGRIRDLLMDLSVQVPAGMSIDTIRIDGDLIDISGQAPSKSAAVDFVRALKTRGWPAAAPSVTSGSGASRHFQLLIKPKPGRKSK